MERNALKLDHPLNEKINYQNAINYIFLLIENSINFVHVFEGLL